MIARFSEGSTVDRIGPMQRTNYNATPRARGANVARRFRTRELSRVLVARSSRAPLGSEERNLGVGVRMPSFAALGGALHQGK